MVEVAVETAILGILRYLVIVEKRVDLVHHLEEELELF